MSIRDTKTYKRIVDNYTNAYEKIRQMESDLAKERDKLREVKEMYDFIESDAQEEDCRLRESFKDPTTGPNNPHK
jgi:uncharacterized protein YutD